MEKKPYIVRSSLVPILACVAALLFSANFYQFMQKNFKKWWGWNFKCPTEQVHYQTHPFELHQDEHRRHRPRRHHRHHHRHTRKERQTIILDMNRHADKARQAQSDLQRQERSLRRNLERAMRDLERMNERMEWDATIATDLERLEHEIRIKALNLGSLQRELERLTPHEDEAESEDIHLFHFDKDNVEIVIKRR